MSETAAGRPSGERERQSGGRGGGGGRRRPARCSSEPVRSPVVAKKKAVANKCHPATKYGT